MMIEVFKTNVQTEEDAGKAISALQCHLPYSKINFDLEDCDKVLRIEAQHIQPDKIIELLGKHGHHCQLLD